MSKGAELKRIPRSPVLEHYGAHHPVSPLPSLLDFPRKVLTRSGRSALILALRASGVRAGDRVLVPTYHCPTMVAPVEMLGAAPEFYPLDQNAIPILHGLERQQGPPAKAMIVAHLFGQPRDLSAILEFCRSRGIALIEDCAHALFGSVGRVPLGSYGDFAIGSLTKFYPVTGGGILVSAERDPSTWLDSSANLRLAAGPAQQLRALWDVVDGSAQAGRMFRLLDSFGEWRRNRSPFPGGYEPPLVSAAEIRDEALVDPLLVPERLRWIDAWLLKILNAGVIAWRRQRNYRALCAGLEGFKGARVLFPECPPTAAPYVVPLLIDDADRRYTAMRRHGLPVFRWDRVWPGTPTWDEDVAPLWSRGLVQIACHQSLRESDVEEILRRLHICFT